MGYKISKGFMWVRGPKLPSEYQEVEYIQSSGTQWIDTGYKYTNPNKIKYELSYNLTASPDQFSYFGSRVQTGTGNGYSGIPYSGKIYTNTTNFGSIAASTNTNYVLSVEFIPSSNTSKVVQYTNETKTYDQAYTNSSYMPPTQTQHIGLFCDINGSGSAIQLASMKAYSFKIWDTDILVRNFVPCYRKSDNVIGMYDRVGGTFYTNSGTGTFSKGNDVAPTYVFKEKQFYPGVGWEPGENTLLYLPLDGDYLDKSSNHNDGTAVGTMSFGQIGNRQYASFGTSSAIQLGTIPVGTGAPQPFTQSVWLKTTASGVGHMHHFGVDSYHNRSCLITFYSSNHMPLQDMYGSSYDTYIGSATTSDLWNKWINLVYTYDNGTHKLYINGELRGTASNTINIGGTTNRYIGRIDANYGGYCMAECIFESVVWSAQEALDYYNLTKSDFGL